MNSAPPGIASSIGLPTTAPGPSRSRSWPRQLPARCRAQLPGSPPEQPETFDAILRDLDSVVTPGLTLWQHPRFFGYFPSNGLLASVLGDLVSTGLGVIGLAWQSSPALTEVEEVTTDWLRQMLGLSSEWSGVIQDTASTSSLVALLCARERTTGYGLGRGGLQAEASPLTVYISAQSHSSVEKAALLAGFGREHVRVVPHDPRVRDARRRARHDGDDRSRKRLPTVCRRGHVRNDHVDGLRSTRGHCRRRAPARPLDACRCGDGRLGDDSPGVPFAVGGRRAGRLADRQRAQMAGRRFRLHALLRSRPGASGARDVHQSQLPADGSGRAGEELSRLGTAARAPVPRLEAVVPGARAGRRRPSRAPPSRSGERADGWPRRFPGRPDGVCSRRCACRPCACDTSPRG